MYCSRCGKQLPAGSRFCPACGAPHADLTSAPGSPENSDYAANSAASSSNTSWSASPGGAAPPPFPAAPRLVRPRSPRMIAGVCSGIALHYGWDVNLVRVVAVVTTLFSGVGLLLYVAAWILIPDAPYLLPKST